MFILTTLAQRYFPPAPFISTRLYIFLTISLLPILKVLTTAAVGSTLVRSFVTLHSNISRTVYPHKTPCVCVVYMKCVCACARVRVRERVCACVFSYQHTHVSEMSLTLHIFKRRPVKHRQNRIPSTIYIISWNMRTNGSPIYGTVSSSSWPSHYIHSCYPSWNIRRRHIL